MGFGRIVATIKEELDEYPLSGKGGGLTPCLPGEITLAPRRDSRRGRLLAKRGEMVPFVLLVERVETFNGCRGD